MKELLDLLSMCYNVLSERHEAEISLKVRNVFYIYLLCPYIICTTTR